MSVLRKSHPSEIVERNKFDHLRVHDPEVVTLLRQIAMRMDELVEEIKILNA